MNNSRVISNIDYFINYINITSEFWHCLFARRAINLTNIINIQAALDMPNLSYPPHGIFLALYQDHMYFFIISSQTSSFAQPNNRCYSYLIPAFPSSFFFFFYFENYGVSLFLLKSQALTSFVNLFGGSMNVRLDSKFILLKIFLDKKSIYLGLTFIFLLRYLKRLNQEYLGSIWNKMV